MHKVLFNSVPYKKSYLNGTDMKYTVWEVQVCIFMKEKQKQDSDHLDPVLSATLS